MAASTYPAGSMMGTTAQRDPQTDSPPQEGRTPGRSSPATPPPQAGRVPLKLAGLCCHLVDPEGLCSRGCPSQPPPGWGTPTDGTETPLGLGGARSLRTSAEGTQVSPGLGRAAVAEL